MSVRSKLRLAPLAAVMSLAQPVTVCAPAFTAKRWLSPLVKLGVVGASGSMPMASAITIVSPSLKILTLSVPPVIDAVPICSSKRGHGKSGVFGKSRATSVMFSKKIPSKSLIA